MKRIPVSEPDLTLHERELLLRAFDSGWISSSGEFVSEFESRWAKFCGTNHSLSVSNGTVALHLVLAALGIKYGDEVIVPNLTFIATANAVKYVGATPIFAEPNIKTWNIDPVQVESLITSKTKAIIAVHLYGYPADLTKLKNICDERGLFLIEDAAEAPSATYEGKPIGSFGIASTFSFYGNKIITSGEGGAVNTSNSRLYEKMKLLRDQGMDKNRRYFFIDVGFNFRLTNLQCALLCAQLDRVDDMLAKRELIYKIYEDSLSGIPGVTFQSLVDNSTRAPWLFTFSLNKENKISARFVMERLKDFGVETRPVFIPIDSLPPYLEVSSKRDINLPSELISAGGISLPTSSAMNEDDANYVAKHLVEILNSGLI